MIRSKFIPCVLFAVALVALPSRPAAASLVDYAVQWSGAAFSNTAVAQATITVDTSLLDNPGDNDAVIGATGAAITAITLTVSGASSGNGDFTTADFDEYSWVWNTALDLDAELVGQPQAGGGLWGISIDPSHDFNLFSAVGSDAPDGEFFYVLQTDAGNGDLMQLTSFAPVLVPVPELTSLAAWGLLGGLGLLKRRERAASR